MIHDTISYIIFILASYLFGNVLYCQLIPQIFKGIDIISLSDDNNPGAANVFQHAGVKMGIICLLLELLKGFLPIFIASMLFESNNIWFSIIIIAPTLGHAFPVFNRFVGGKSIAVIFGELLGLTVLSPVVVVLAIIYIMLSTVIKIGSRRTRSVVVFALFAIISLLIEIYFGRVYVGIGCVAISLIAIAKHTFLQNSKIRSM